VRIFGHKLGLSAYGVCFVLGCLVALAILLWDARRRGDERAPLVALAFWTLVAGLLGARLGDIVWHLPESWRACQLAPLGERAAACTRPLQLWRGGLSYLGGVAGALVGAALFCHRAGMSFLRAGDRLAPAAAAGLVLGHLGCLLEGSCYGRRVTPPFVVGVRFGEGTYAFADHAAAGAISWSARMTPPLHPTQLYAAACALATLAVLVLLRPRRPGLVLAAFLFLNAMSVAVVDCFRGEPDRRLVASLAAPTFLSLTQLGCLLLAVGAISLTIALRPTRAP